MMTNSASNKLPLKPTSECRILMVDDDTRYLDAFSGLLNIEGYQIITATNASDALKAARNDSPDVIILDVRMPGKSGIEVCEEIKAWPGYLPIILVTGANERNMRIQGLGAGADDFLDKPVDALELRARVRSLLRTKQLYDEVEASRATLEEQVAERTMELREANKRLQELNEVKARALAIVAHELRTPLQQIIGSLDLFKKPGLTGEARETVERTIDESLSRLKNRIDDIDVFSDPGALKPIGVSVHSIVHPALERVRTMQRTHIERVRMDIADNLPPVMVDPRALTHTLAHMIDNALKFGGEAPVDVRARKHEDGVELEVQDYGAGINEELLPIIFSPLQQGDDRITRVKDGMGLGLALVKTLLDAHDIELHIETSKQEGTTLSMVLPPAKLS